MDVTVYDKDAADEAKKNIQYRWTEEKTLQFILHRHQRRHLFNKKKNTSRAGWQGILNDMGIAQYMTHHQAQKKWNNLWSRYKTIKKGLGDGERPSAEDPSVWPFFDVMDAIATGHPIGVAVTTLQPVQESATEETRAITITSIVDVDQVEIPPEEPIEAQDEPVTKKPRLLEPKPEPEIYPSVHEGALHDKLLPLLDNLCQQVNLLRESMDLNTERIVSAIERVTKTLQTRKDIIDGGDCG